MKAVIDLPAAPRPPRPVAAVAAVLVLLFLGMSLVAAREVAVRCQTTENCLGMGSGQCLGFGHGSAMGFGGQTTRCELSAWDVRFPLPERAADILQWLGVRFSYN
jgi:hypothetical protein